MAKPATHTSAVASPVQRSHPSSWGRSTVAADDPPSSDMECARVVSSWLRPVASRSDMFQLLLPDRATREARLHGGPVDVVEQPGQVLGLLRLVIREVGVLPAVDR